MSITSGFFNANIVNGDYDRKYTADQLAEFFSTLIGNGVSAGIQNSFKVIPGSGLTLNISPGFGWINGFWVKNDSNYSIVESAAPSSGYRKDLIVLRFDRSNRSITPTIITGSVSSSSPATVPSYVRTNTQYDIVLAVISFAAGDSSITASMIEDTRDNLEYCGIINTFDSIAIPDGSITPRKLDLSSGFYPTGPITLSKNVHYFDSEEDLPSPGNIGRLYFVKVNT